MFKEDDTKESFKEERKREPAGKYKALPRNPRTERDMERIFKYGTEPELMEFLRKNGVPDGSPRFVEIVKLFREHGGRRR